MPISGRNSTRWPPGTASTGCGSGARRRAGQRTRRCAGQPRHRRDAGQARIIRAMRQIFLDTETTGLEARLGHRIIELACVEMVNRRLTRRHLLLRQSGSRYRRGALAVGISREFLADKPRLAKSPTSSSTSSRCRTGHPQRRLRYRLPRLRTGHARAGHRVVGLRQCPRHAEDGARLHPARRTTSMRCAALQRE